MMNRRSFVKRSMLGMMPLLFPMRVFSILAHHDKNYFIHGVASGDPTIDSVIIWTHINTVVQEICNVEWQIASDPSFKNIAKRGLIATSAERDYTLKADVSELESNQVYYYRFLFKDAVSDIGVCKTLPVSLLNALQIAVISCNNYEDGYFTSFRHIADNP